MNLRELHALVHELMLKGLGPYEVCSPLEGEIQPLRAYDVDPKEQQIILHQYKSKKVL